MRLKVLLPTEVLVDREVTRVIAEGENGSFCLLPRHIDFVAALVPGILCFHEQEAEADEEQPPDPSAKVKETFLAVDEGLLVKCGAEVLVSTRNAVGGVDLGELREAVETQYRIKDEHERVAESATAKLEAGLVRRFLELEQHG